MNELADNQVKIGAWVWTQHPTAPLPTVEWIVAQGQSRGPSWVDSFHRQREEAIAREVHDPLVYGWEQPPVAIMRQLFEGTYVPGAFGTSMVNSQWSMVKPANDIVLLGGNGSGKTEVQGKFAMEVLTAKPTREARCFSQNEQTSVRYIQRAMYRYLPPALRKVKRQGTTTKISYSEATGFSENLFILPNHGTGLFPTYKGYQQDPKSVEGGEADIVTWDEEAPAELLKTLRFRVHKKGGVMLGGFTPVDGYTETVAEYVEGAKIIECIPARAVEWDWWNRTWKWGRWLLPKNKELVKGCPPGHVPFVIQSGQGNGRRFAVVMPTVFNPYTNVEAIIGEVDGKPIEDALMRLWGWTSKLARKAFPNFSEVHIVPPGRVPPLNTLTIWHWADPHGDRNWFMNWTGVDAFGNKWTFMDWPGPPEGDWALPGSKPDGKIGPAQTLGGGKSFNDYKRLIMELEGWRVSEDGSWKLGDRKRTEEQFETFEVFDRQMDPRPAGTSVPSDEDSRTFIDHMGDAIRSVSSGTVIAPGLHFQAGPDCSIEEGKQWVNEWINAGWDPKQEVTPMNCPKWYIASTCVNTIWALRTYTGVDGLKGACKDPIDCLKGLSKSGIRHVPKGSLGSYVTGN